MRIGFKATGNYHRPLAHFLRTEGFHLELIPSLAVARTREAMHNSRSSSIWGQSRERRVV